MMELWLIQGTDSEGKEWSWNRANGSWFAEARHGGKFESKAAALSAISPVISRNRMLDREDQMESIEVVKYNDSEAHT